MKLFLKKVLLYIGVPIVICHILFMVLYFVLTVQANDRLGKIGKENVIMIMGDSQMTKISPEYFDQPAYSVATPGEHYYFTLSKLEKVLASPDNKVECVLVGISIHTFAPLFVNHFSLNAPEGKGSLRRYLMFFDIFNSEFINPMRIILNKDFFLGIILGSEWGGYEIHDGENPSQKAIEDRVKDIFGRDFIDDLQNSSKQEYYLEKIAELCKAKNIKLVLISNPVHPDYRQQVEQVYFEKLGKTLSNYDDLLYLNYLNDSLPGSYFDDANHVNRKAAEIYSKKINDELLKNKLIQPQHASAAQ